MKLRGNVRLNLLVQRVLHIVLVAFIGAALFSGARWLFQHNYTNHKTWEDIALRYKYRYDFAKYTGATNKHALKAAVLPGTAKAAAAPTSAMATSVPVLLYHRIANDTNPFNVSVAAFKDQMFSLKRAGWRTISMGDYLAFQQGKKKLPEKSFLLTFDDGTKDSYYPVQPILTALNYRATNFIITRYSVEQPAGSHYYLSVNEMKQMQASGHWDLEPHTHNGHTYYPIDAKGTKGTFYPNKIWLASKHRMETDHEYALRVLGDMRVAKAEVEKISGHPAKAMAFPFGDVGEEDTSNYQKAEDMLHADVANTFQVGMLQYFGGRGTSQNYFGNKQVYAYRIEVSGGYDGAQLLHFLQRGEAKPLPFNDTFQANHGWLKSHGVMQIAHNALTIQSTPETTGASAVLDGTKAWRNYTFTADIVLQQGTSFSLFARNQGPLFQAGCNFSKNYLATYTEKGDDYRPVADDNFYLPVGVKLNVSVRVHDNTVECLTNGVVLSRTDIPGGLPATGGIGISTWDPNHHAILQASNITVTPEKEQRSHGTQ